MVEIHNLLPFRKNKFCKTKTFYNFSEFSNTYITIFCTRENKNHEKHSFKVFNHINIYLHGNAYKCAHWYILTNLLGKLHIIQTIEHLHTHTCKQLNDIQH